MAQDFTVNDPPMPPAPVARVARSAGQSQALPALLSEMSDHFGYPAAIRMLPGNIPAIDVPPERLVETCRYLRDQLGFILLSCISGVDMRAFRQVVYHLRNLQQPALLEVKVTVPESNQIDSVISVWNGANPLERETYDLMGVIFLGHPDLRRILLDDEFVGYPLLKSFKQTPLAIHDPATTQASAVQSVEGAVQEGIGSQRVTTTQLSQGPIEHLHPGVSTFGNDQFHGTEFPPLTWKHRPEYRGTGDNTENGPVAEGDETK